MYIIPYSSRLLSLINSIKSIGKGAIYDHVPILPLQFTWSFDAKAKFTENRTEGSSVLAFGTVSENFFKFAKGQLISKWFFGVVDFLQKMNKNKSTWGIIAVKSNLFVHFLEEIDDPKNHFEINWPLGSSPYYDMYNKIFHQLIKKANRL